MLWCCHGNTQGSKQSLGVGRTVGSSGNIQTAAASRCLMVGLLPTQGDVAGAVSSELIFSPAWGWEDFFLTWENMDMLVPIHVRR